MTLRKCDKDERLTSFETKRARDDTEPKLFDYDDVSGYMYQHKGIIFGIGRIGEDPTVRVSMLNQITDDEEARFPNSSRYDLYGLRLSKSNFEDSKEPKAYRLYAAHFPGQLTHELEQQLKVTFNIDDEGSIHAWAERLSIAGMKEILDFLKETPTMGLQSLATAALMGRWRR